MAVVHFDKAPADSDRKTSGAKSRGWLQRISAAIMLPIMLGLIIFKPKWFEADE